MKTKTKTRQKRAYVHRKRHEFFTARNMTEAFIVMRIDNYKTDPNTRGQFYPALNEIADASKAIWPDEEKALAAARWAVKTFGNQYGIFKMTHVVEKKEQPIAIIGV